MSGPVRLERVERGVPLVILSAEFGSQGFVFDGKSMRFKDAATNRFVSGAQMNAIRNTVAQQAKTKLQDLGKQYANAQDWYAEGRIGQEIIKTAQMANTTQYILGRGGVKNMTPADWKMLGNLNKETADTISGSKWAEGSDAYSEAQVANFAGMAAGDSVAAHSHAQDALYGITLPAHPAEGTECLGNCRCTWEVVRFIDAEGEPYIEATWNAVDDGGTCATCAARASMYAPWVSKESPPDETASAAGYPPDDIAPEPAVNKQGHYAGEMSACDESDLECRASFVESNDTPNFYGRDQEMSSEAKAILDEWGDNPFDSTLGTAHDALSQYTGSGYGWMNQAGRGTELGLSDYRRSMIASLDEGLAKHGMELKEGVNVYRGMGEGLPDLLQRGDTITDWGFMSTSLDKSVASGFGRDGHKLEIYLPPGTRGMHANGLGLMGEKEFLLPRGSTLRVLDVETVDNWGSPVHNVIAELLLPNEYR